MYDDDELRDELREKYTDEDGNYHPERLSSDLNAAKRFMFRLYLLISMAFILGGLAFTFIGTLQVCSIIKSKKVCTELVEGFVLDFKSERADSSDPNSSLVYAPVFSYTYEGREYTYSGSSYSDKGKLNRGQDVHVYVDPDDPYNIYVPEYTVEKKNAILFIIIGLAVSGGAIGYCIYQSRKFNKGVDRLTDDDTA